MGFALSHMCSDPVGTVRSIAASAGGSLAGLTLRYITASHDEQSAISLPRLGAICW